MTEGTRWQFAVFLVLLVLLHFVLRVGLGLGPYAPNLLVVALLLGARRYRAGGAAGLGVLLGLLDGAVNPFTMGATSLVLAVLGYLGSRSREVLAGDSPVLLALYLFAGKWLFDILLFALLATRGLAGSPTELLLSAPLSALYAAAAGVAAVAAYRVVA